MAKVVQKYAYRPEAVTWAGHIAPEEQRVRDAGRRCKRHDHAWPLSMIQSVVYQQVRYPLQTRRCVNAA